MLTEERLSLVAPCGIDCGICELYTCRDDAELQEKIVARGIPEEKLPCEGCRSVEGNCPVLGERCETFKCVSEVGAEFCFECGDFPCTNLQPTANRADVLPHNMKVFNLCTIKQFGREGFVKKSAEIKRRYYTGKMEIGKGPQL